MIQLAILNTRTSPNTDSYINYFLEDIKILSEKGMRVLKNGKKLYKKVKVHLSLVSGDSVAVRSMSHMKMYNSEYPCMLCRIKRKKFCNDDKGKHILIRSQESARLRDINDFLHGDEEVQNIRIFIYQGLNF
jgi:hypothetical protein